MPTVIVGTILMSRACDYTRMNKIDTTYKNYSSYYA